MSKNPFDLVPVFPCPVAAPVQDALTLSTNSTCAGIWIGFVEALTSVIFGFVSTCPAIGTSSLLNFNLTSTLEKLNIIKNKRTNITIAVIPPPIINIFFFLARASEVSGESSKLILLFLLNRFEKKVETPLSGLTILVKSFPVNLVLGEELITLCVSLLCIGSFGSFSKPASILA